MEIMKIKGIYLSLFSIIMLGGILWFISGFIERQYITIDGWDYGALLTSTLYFIYSIVSFIIVVVLGFTLQEKFRIAKKWHFVIGATLGLGVCFISMHLLRETRDKMLNSFNGNNYEIINVTSNIISTGDEAKLSYNIQGCAADPEKNENASGSDTRSTDMNKVSVTQDSTERKLSYKRVATHACCKTVEIKKEIKEGEILLTEEWKGMPCKCMCTTNIEAELVNIPYGAYQVTIQSQDVYYDYDPVLLYEDNIVFRVSTI